MAGKYTSSSRASYKSKQQSWIKSTARSQDGRKDMKALRKHYSGEGNQSYRIGEDGKIKATFHYKSERSFPFDKFLDKFQRMVNIYKEEGETILEPTKVRLLLDKIKEPPFSAAVKVVQVNQNFEGANFIHAENYLAALGLF